MGGPRPSVGGCPGPPGPIAGYRPGLHDNSVIRTVHSLSFNDELKPIANFYHVDVNQLAFKCRHFARNCVMCKIGLDT